MNTIDSLKHVNDSLINKIDLLSSPTNFHLSNDSLNFVVKNIVNPESGWDKLWSNTPTILGILLAAFFAIYQVKLNLITAARIKWIEELRKDVAEYNQTVIEIIVETKFPNSKSNFTVIDKYHEAIVIKHRIAMTLNLDEKLHYTLLALMEYTFQNMKKKNKLDDETHNDNISLVNTEITVVASKIFKTEWEKSKRILPKIYEIKHYLNDSEKRAIDRQILNLKFPVI